MRGRQTAPHIHIDKDVMTQNCAGLFLVSVSVSAGINGTTGILEKGFDSPDLPALMTPAATAARLNRVEEFAT